MRLIDADLLMRSFQVDMCGSFTCHECPLLNDDGECGFEVFISDTPTVDAEPVRHGRWIDKGEYAVCMECSGRSGTQYDGVEPIPLMTQFCPHCGAKMDEVMNNENK